MDPLLRYCPDVEARLERLPSLYTDRRQDRIFARMEVETQALRKFAAKYPPGYTECPDLAERVAFWDELLAERAAIRDDSIPSAYLSEMDQGLYGGMVGGKVQFMAHPENGWISSMVPPHVGGLGGPREAGHRSRNRRGTAFISRNWNCSARRARASSASAISS